MKIWFFTSFSTNFVLNIPRLDSKEGMKEVH